MKGSADKTRSLTNTIAYLNGKNSVLDIAEILNRNFSEISSVIKELKNTGLIEEVCHVGRQ